MTTLDRRSTWQWQPIVVSWLLTLGVDFFFNGGVFSRLFERSREPSLLVDNSLFKRIPVAYAALALGVIALAWLFERLDVRGWRSGALGGAIVGVVIASLGVISLWTAVDITGLFVVAAVGVQIAEVGSAGAFLGSYATSSDPRRLARLGLGATVVLGVLGVVLQNLLAT